MAILSKKKGKTLEGPYGGYDNDRLSNTIYGPKRRKISRKKSIFNSDYIYKPTPYDEDGCEEIEVGINKNTYRYHTSDWADDLKDEDFQEDKDMLRRLFGCDDD